MHRPTTLERAYQMARSGDYPDVKSLRDGLKRERFDCAQLAGSRTLSVDLMRLCRASHAARAAAMAPEAAAAQPG